MEDCREFDDRVFHFIREGAETAKKHFRGGINNTLYEHRTVMKIRCYNVR